MTDDTQDSQEYRCEGCGDPITDAQTAVYGDEGQYHMGCEFSEVYESV